MYGLQPVAVVVVMMPVMMVVPAIRHAIVVVIVMMIVPLPATILDILITLNITAGLGILITTMFVPRALDFAAFPSMLLITTLFRLAINISVTRLILYLINISEPPKPD